jgi:magnesium chelatase family protein
MRYKAKLSGPLLDRIDLHINVPAVEIEKLISQKKEGTKSEEIRKLVEKARRIQLARFKGLGVYTNSRMKNKQINQFCNIEPQALVLLKQAVQNFNLSARTYFRLIKISQTIADLAEEKSVRATHVAEALQYRVRVQE